MRNEYSDVPYFRWISRASASMTLWSTPLCSTRTRSIGVNAAPHMATQSYNVLSRSVMTVAMDDFMPSSGAVSRQSFVSHRSDVTHRDGPEQHPSGSDDSLPARTQAALLVEICPEMARVAASSLLTDHNSSFLSPRLHHGAHLPTSRSHR